MNELFWMILLVDGPLLLGMAIAAYLLNRPAPNEALGSP